MYKVVNTLYNKDAKTIITLQRLSEGHLVVLVLEKHCYQDGVYVVRRETL